MSKHFRLFIASHIPPFAAEPLIILTQALQTQFEHHPPVLRWVAPEHWHLTWHFLGQTPTEAIPVLESALENAVETVQNALLSQRTPLTTHWQELCWWPSKHRPQILVGLMQNSPAIQAMAKAIQQAVDNSVSSATKENKSSQHSQHKKESSHKAFNPHITLARLKDKNYRGPLPNLPDVPSGIPEWQIDTVTLFSSKLDSSGAVHTPLFTKTVTVPPGE